MNIKEFIKKSKYPIIYILMIVGASYLLQYFAMQMAERRTWDYKNTYTLDEYPIKQEQKQKEVFDKENIKVLEAEKKDMLDIESDSVDQKDEDYKAYKDKIVKLVNNSEETIYTLDQKMNIDAGEEIYFIKDEPNLRLSPNSNILFFDYFKGLANCRMNALQLDSNTLLWDDMVGCGAEIYWSPDNKQVALVWNQYDKLYIYISKYGDIKTLVEKTRLFYPSDFMDKTKDFYWQENNTFVFSASSDIPESVKKALIDNDLVIGGNEFIVR